MGEITWPEEGPEVDVWNHIHTGLDLAEEEFLDLPEHLRELTKGLGQALFGMRTRFVVERGEAHFLDLDKRLLSEPWIQYAADYYVAGEGVRRAAEALERYLELRPSLAPKSLEGKALRYATEVVHTYVFGFDPACIALCRATLEQVLKEAVVARNIYTAAQLRREKPGAGALLENAKRASCIPSTYAAAKRVIERGDTLMHSHIFEDKVLRKMAADSILDLTVAVAELLAVA
jgi:hypothetical protein